MSVRSTPPPSGRRSAASIPISVGQVAADERLATGDAELLDAQADEDPRDPLDLLEGQHLVLREELRSRGRRPPWACSRCTGSCSDRSPRSAGRAWRGPSCRSVRAVRRTPPWVASRYRSPPPRRGRPGRSSGAPRQHPDLRRGPAHPPVPPAHTAGTSSELHRTDPRWHDASTSRMPGPPGRPPSTRHDRPTESPNLTSEDPDAMAQTDTKPGFRLPWSSDRPDASDTTGAATDASAAGDAPATEENEGPDMIDASHAVQDTDATEAVAEPVETAEVSSTEPEASSEPVADPSPKRSSSLLPPKRSSRPRPPRNPPRRRPSRSSPRSSSPT